MKYSKTLFALGVIFPVLNGPVAFAEGNCGDESFWHHCECTKNGRTLIQKRTCLGVLDDRYLEKLAKEEARCKARETRNSYCEVVNTGRR